MSIQRYNTIITRRRYYRLGENELLSDVPVITTCLDCGSRSLTSLKGIEHLINLEVIHCRNNNITIESVEYLLKLPKLIALYINKNPNFMPGYKRPNGYSNDQEKIFINQVKKEYYANLIQKWWRKKYYGI